jgi:hypothetical protein
MKLVLIRDQSDANGTFGRLYINGLFECHTFEDPDRQLEKQGTVKVQNDSAIPRGIYQVIIDMSVRFKKLMMRLLNVPDFSGIRIHAGNTKKDTEGCILLGNGRTRVGLFDSRTAVDKVFSAVDRALKAGDKVTIEIK